MNNKVKLSIGLMAVLILFAAGAVSYYQRTYLSAQAETDQATLHTATARRGDLVIYASGRCTLASAEEYELGFSTNGQVTGVFVKPGNDVKAGDLLAQIDDSQVHKTFTQAQLAYEALTSDAAVAEALQNVAEAEKALHSAKLQLEYLISPDVMYWETEVADTQTAIEEAQTKLNVSPADEEAQKILDKKKAYLDFAEAQLETAQVRYTATYIYKYFLVQDPAGDYLILPTENEIFAARADIIQAEQNLKESQQVYAALTTGEIPDGTSIPALVSIRQAKIKLDEAQATLDGTSIIAPAAGTVMSVDTSVGNTAGTGTVITLANLNNLVLDIYLDASDWANVAVGKPVEVTFDSLPDSTYPGTVTQIDTELYISGNATMIHGTVALASAPSIHQFPLGSAALVDVIGAQAKDAVLIPVEALHKAGDQYAVFVMVNGTPKLRVVEVGIQDSISAEIISGIKAGDVVTTGISDTSW